jgi:hypothetical protein
MAALSWWSLVPQTLLDKFFDDRVPGWHAEPAGAIRGQMVFK